MAIKGPKARKNEAPSWSNWLPRGISPSKPSLFNCLDLCNWSVSLSLLKLGGGMTVEGREPSVRSSWISSKLPDIFLLSSSFLNISSSSPSFSVLSARTDRDWVVGGRTIKISRTTCLVYLNGSINLLILIKYLLWGVECFLIDTRCRHLCAMPRPLPKQMCTRRDDILL